MHSEIINHRETPDGKGASQLARGLGWLGMGLGITELAAPRTLARAIGVECDPGTRWTMRALGAREIASGAGIFARPAMAAPVWSRVAGDAIDLALLGYALRTRSVHPRRTVVAILLVAGVTALDAYAGSKVSGSEHRHRPRRRDTRVLTVTVNLPITDVQRRWREVARDLAKRGNVTFRPAPGGRGTEICLAIKSPSRLAQMFGRLTHTDVEQLADGDLRKVKQLLELGEIVHSDASVRRGLHAAQPPERDLHLPESEGAITAGEVRERAETESVESPQEVRP